MAALTYFVVLRFDRNEEHEFRIAEAENCPTSVVAIRRAESMAKMGAGTIAFSRT